jgi:spore germination protein YaaH
VTYLEAFGVASLAQVRIERGPTGAPFFTWRDGAGPHVTWFDDAESTARGLGAWTHDVLPPDVGVLFYGLGAEDPRLWDELAVRLP